MSRREKLLAKMRFSPWSIRFAEVEALLKHEGFALVNKRGSHRTFAHADGRSLVIVQPHGGRKTCHRDDIRDLLRVLNLT